MTSIRAHIETCVVLKNLQPAVPAVENDDIATVAIESDA
jgi:hypothetical protein